MVKLKITLGLFLIAASMLTQAQQKPNIIFLMADDHATSAIGV